jgi:DNA-binding NarL/FixJ family response regulator
MAQKNSYDVILMDLSMPTLDGIEAARRILNPASGLTLPGRRPIIFAHTANETKAEQDECLKIGVHGFLAKPLLMAELVEALKSASAALNKSPQELEDFARLTSHVVAQLETAGKSRNLQELVGAAQKLQESAKNFGAMRLASLCKQLGDRAENRGTEEIENLIQQVAEEYKSVKLSLTTEWKKAA